MFGVPTGHATSAPPPGCERRFGTHEGQDLALESVFGVYLASASDDGSEAEEVEFHGTAHEALRNRVSRLRDKKPRFGLMPRYD